MNIIEAGVEAITERRPLERIELAGRVCYNSTDKIAEGTAEKFVRNLVKNGHQTPLEAARIVVPVKTAFSILDKPELPGRTGRVVDLIHSMMEARVPRCGTCGDGSFSGNARDIFNAMCDNYCGTVDELIELLKSPEVKIDNNFATFKITCDRGIGNELVRHRVLHYDDNSVICTGSSSRYSDDMSMVQASTRYISFGKFPFSVIRPTPAGWASDENSHVFETWRAACEQSIAAYNEMLNAGVAPQYARDVLPLSTATTIIMSGTSYQWDYFMKLRSDKAAHPQMRYLVLKLLECPEMRRLYLDSDGVLYNNKYNLSGYSEYGPWTGQEYDCWIDDVKNQLGV